MRVELKGGVGNSGPKTFMPKQLKLHAFMNSWVLEGSNVVAGTT